MSGIRTADIPDIAAIVELGAELLAQSVYRDIKPDEQKFKMTIAGLMGHKRGVVYVVVDDDDKPQGFFAGIADEYAWSRARFATDMWVYIRDPYRRYAASLYNQFITWAKARPRVAFIEFAQSGGAGNYERWCRLMESLGLNRVGSIYMLEVSHVGNR